MVFILFIYAIVTKDVTIRIFGFPSSAYYYLLITRVLNKNSFISNRIELGLRYWP